MAKTPEPWAPGEMLELAGRGVGRVDRDGLRGATLVTMEEIAAMAAVLALVGVKPVYPGTYPPPDLIPHTEGERA